MIGGNTKEVNSFIFTGLLILSGESKIQKSVCVTKFKGVSGQHPHKIEQYIMLFPQHIIIITIILSSIQTVPPQRVTISGGDGPLRAGETVTLTCVSSNSNPRSTITWFARGRQIPTGEVSQSYEVSSLGGYVTRSTVSVTLSHQEHNVIYTCQATNDVGQTVADTVTLSVLCK